MAYYLPEYTRLQKTPAVQVACWEDTPPEIKPIVIETLELKTMDIINAFCRLQNQAMANATKESNRMRREEAIVRIKSMTFFYDKVRAYRAQKAAEARIDI